MSECIKYCGQCNKTDLPNIRDKEPVHIGYSYAYKTDCEGDAYIKAEEVKNLIEQTRADAIDELCKVIEPYIQDINTNEIWSHSDNEKQMFDWTNAWKIALYRKIEQIKERTDEQT